jgi:hypothetical protein
MFEEYSNSTIKQTAIERHAVLIPIKEIPTYNPIPIGHNSACLSLVSRPPKSLHKCALVMEMKFTDTI